MDFETLDHILLNALSEDKIAGPTPGEEVVIKKIKQGKHLLLDLVNQKNVDTILFWITVMKAPQAFEGAPRVLWVTPSNDRAKFLIATLQKWVRRSEIAVESANETGKIIEQRNNIFDGADIIIGTPKRIMELYNQNGFHINKLSLFLIDNADSLCAQPTQLQHIRRLCESMEKCQKLFVNYSHHDRLIPFVEEICYSYEEIEI